jgi:hypothetical protein
MASGCGTFKLLIALGGAGLNCLVRVLDQGRGVSDAFGMTTSILTAIPCRALIGCRENHASVKLYVAEACAMVESRL